MKTAKEYAPVASYTIAQFEEEFSIIYGRLPLSTLYRKAGYSLPEITDETAWMYREFARSDSGLYQMVVIPGLDSEIIRRMRSVDFVHMVSAKDMLIAYTPNPDKGKRDVKVKTTFAKYLMARAGDYYNERDINTIVQLFREKYVPPEIYFATTATEIEEVYLNGPSSCMSHSRGAYSTSGIHPTAVYESPDLELAYTKRSNYGISTRSLLVRDGVGGPKRYIRIYGTGSLERALLDDGYTRGTMDGVRLKRIPVPYSNYLFVMPYVDSPPDHPKVIADPRQPEEYFLVGRRGIIVGRSTSGSISVRNAAKIWGIKIPCPDCGTMFSPKGQALYERTNHIICGPCVDRAYTTCSWCHNIMKTTEKFSLTKEETTRIYCQNCFRSMYPWQQSDEEAAAKLLQEQSYSYTTTVAGTYVVRTTSGTANF